MSRTHSVFAYWLPVLLLCLCSCQTNRGTPGGSGEEAHAYVELSDKSHAYFALSDGQPYIPIGLNMIAPGRGAREGEAQGLAEIERWMKALSDNGGNYVRIWLSSPFWDIEHEQAGVYDEAKARRIDRFLALARKYRLRVKMTVEHFRALTPQESTQSWALKSVYHSSNGGPLDSIAQYITAEAGHHLMQKKLDYYQRRYGDDPIIFGWELWNEMNAMQVPKDSAFIFWNEKMLGELKRRFPKNLAMQSLGSFDHVRVRGIYKRLMGMGGNDVAQVHRYLDLGASMDICHGPMDMICADAIREIAGYNTNKPVLLAETGAVEPRHTGPSRYYTQDTLGIILHDALFAPFFAGAAGAGMIWHWDQYVAQNNLWHHFNRFAQVVENLNPAEQQLRPFYLETNDMRVYGLKGRQVFLLWCRDKESTWQTELRDGLAPRWLQDAVLSHAEVPEPKAFKSLRSFDPWKNEWQDLDTDGNQLVLPDFQRSVIVKGIIKR